MYPARGGRWWWMGWGEKVADKRLIAILWLNTVVPFAKHRGLE